MKIRPEVGARAPVMTLISVDLPAPLSPMSPTISLRPIERSMSRSACTAPKYFCTPSRRTMDAKSPPAIIAFPSRSHFGSAGGDPKRLVPQNNSVGKRWLRLVSRREGPAGEQSLEHLVAAGLDGLLSIRPGLENCLIPLIQSP